MSEMIKSGSIVALALLLAWSIGALFMVKNSLERAEKEAATCHESLIKQNAIVETWKQQAINLRNRIKENGSVAATRLARAEAAIRSRKPISPNLTCPKAALEFTKSRNASAEVWNEGN